MAKVAKVICVRSEAHPTQNGSRSKEIPSPSSQGSPKTVVGNYGLDTVPVQWDDSPVIRDRIRDNHNLLLRFNHATGQHESGCFIEANNENVKLNASVLKPVLGVMGENDLQLPSIESLNVAIEAFYQLSKVSRCSDLIYQESWAIRRMIGRMKKFTYRASPPQDICFSTIF